MRKKPKSREYRNLWLRGNVIQIELIDENGKRHCKSAKTDDWDTAARRRDKWERELLGQLPEDVSMTFAQAAREALAYMEKRRGAATTGQDRNLLLKDGGRIMRYIGLLPLKNIDVSVLRHWHDTEIVNRDRSFKTGDNHLDAIEMVLRWARGHGHLSRKHKPVTELRDDLRPELRYKNVKAKKDENRRLAKKNTLNPEEVGRLVQAAEEEGTEPPVIVLLAVESGLRRGEIKGLLWGDVAWGEDEHDPTRRLVLRHNRPRGLPQDVLKSGLQREPHISSRLEFSLRSLYRARFQPGPNSEVVKENYWSLEERVLRRVCERAGLPKRTFQNLRATASSLLTEWTKDPVYVRHVIGHADEGVATAHYNKLDLTRYKPAEPLDPETENPMDLFARLCVPREQVPAVVPALKIESEGIPGVTWRSQRESNPCLSLERAPS